MTKLYVNNMLTKGAVNNTLNINKEVIKDCEITSFSTSDFS